MPIRQCNYKLKESTRNNAEHVIMKEKHENIELCHIKHMIYLKKAI